MEKQKNSSKTNKNRTQKDYTLDFKLGIVMFVEKVDMI